jgi:hypothetical protein
LVLFPAEILAYAAREVRPQGLWWDLSPCEGHVDSFLEAFVLPPLRVHEWDRLRFVLPGDALLDASIADPRLSSTGSTESLLGLGTGRDVRRKQCRSRATAGGAPSCAA